MAERRMFAKTIIDSDAFLDMPLSTQALYFHLSMRADDEGFINNPKKIMRVINASEDDFKVLIGKKFIIPFESGIVVIKHWKIHNYIRSDRLKETVYKNEKKEIIEKENGSYSLICKQEELEYKNLRKLAYEESYLPYSFEYKIKESFIGEICPICNSKMQETIEDGIVTKNRIPSIQHNIPISKGGKHELGNISIICIQCNKEIKDNETGKLNSIEVIEMWDKINDNQMTDNCQHRLGKVRLVKSSLGKDSLGNIDQQEKKENKITKKEKENIILPNEFRNIPENLQNKILEFAEYRTKIKKPIKTERPIKSMINQIGKEYVNEEHLIMCIDETMNHEWQGVKGEYVKYSKNGGDKKEWNMWD